MPHFAELEIGEPWQMVAPRGHRERAIHREIPHEMATKTEKVSHSFPIVERETENVL